MNEIRTDLAIEAHEMCSKEKAKKNHFNGIDVKEYNTDDVFVTVIKILNDEGEKILSKPKGTYITIETPEIRHSDNAYEKTCIEISNQIKDLCKINEKSKILVAGLGNKQITSDALGPETVSNLMITNHIKTQIKGYLDEAYSNVCAIIPGVLGTTGIETIDIIKGVCDKVKPDVVICIDALAARKMDRVATTFQICDTGINPGSGVSNNREGINEKSLGIKVIAIGVPTVVDAATIAVDLIDIAGIDKNRNYNNSNLFIQNIINSNTKNMMVTPKDIDAVIKRCGKTIANGINLALHKNLTFKDIESYVG